MNTPTNGNSTGRETRYGLLVSSQTLVREGLKNLVSSVDSDIVVLDASSLSGLLAKLDGIGRVALIIVDAPMIKADRVVGIGPLRAKFPDARLIFLGDSNEPRDVLGTVELGADGYIPSSLDYESASDALRFIMSCKDCVSLILDADDLTARPRTIGSGDTLVTADPTTTSGDPSQPLTPRELSVLSLLAKGHTNDQIARDLKIRSSTAKVHLLNLRRKLGAANRTEAVVIAQRQGMNL